MSSSGRLLTSAELGLTPDAEQFRPVVALMRRDFILPAYGFLDALFCELLSRGSMAPAVDAEQLTAELNSDPALADAVHDEYVAAYAAAVSVSYQAADDMPEPTNVWRAAVPTQAPDICAFVRAMRVGVIPRLAQGAVPPSVAGAATKRDVLLVEKEVIAGELLGADHDVVWGHLTRTDATAFLARKHGSTRKSVESMVRRHRSDKPSLGIHSHASKSGGKTWLRQVRDTLWFERLRPLHPPQLVPSSLDRTAKVLEAAREIVERRAQPRRVPRKTNPVPTRREDVEHLLPDALWRAFAPLLPQVSPPARPSRDVLLGALVVRRYDIPWASLPKELGLGSGQMIKRRLDQWRKSPEWPRVAFLLALHLPAVALSRA